MDWIEQLLKINPDNGSGSMEFMVAIAVGFLVIPQGLRWYKSRQNKP